ncbi:hypothetical protein JR316_0006475 [Psilocybe cubensis]|uniref:Uncharacterized protein n=1 Tax=Psilocybe cubensis TaxID=181762 RepID=A0ACB8H1Q8_PSICU|nr:hypothetical protein JR316_0006475 [Psilocybe cubensis]KAH9481945.1 hypothetical protein JR316_0006475 [Psilocybe cubensis]
MFYESLKCETVFYQWWLMRPMLCRIGVLAFEKNTEHWEFSALYCQKTFQWLLCQLPFLREFVTTPVLLVEKLAYECDLTKIGSSVISTVKAKKTKNIREATIYPKATDKDYAINHGSRRGAHGAHNTTLDSNCDVPVDLHAIDKEGAVDPELRKVILEWRKSLWHRDFGDSMFGPSGILSNNAVNKLASYGAILRLTKLNEILGGNWPWFGKYGDELLALFRTTVIAPAKPKPSRAQTTAKRTLDGIMGVRENFPAMARIVDNPTDAVPPDYTLPAFQAVRNAHKAAVPGVTDEQAVVALKAIWHAMNEVQKAALSYPNPDWR